MTAFLVYFSYSSYESGEYKTDWIYRLVNAIGFKEACCILETRYLNASNFKNCNENL